MTKRQRDRVRYLRWLRRNRPRKFRYRMRRWAWTLAPVVAFNVAPWLLSYEETENRECLRWAVDYEGVTVNVAWEGSRFYRELPDWGTREPLTCVGWRWGSIR